MSILKTFGRYEALEQTATRDLRVCFSGRDSQDGREVVIKVWADQAPEFSDRFLAAAKHAAELDHPNIVKVLDFGIEDGTAYLVEEQTSGENLRQRMKREPPISLDEKVQVLLGVSEGLGHAHSKAVIHHDLKPANIWIAEDGRPKIAEIGVAGLQAGQAGATRLGNVLEMFGYLAPEQLRDQASDERADFFAFGALAYELITSSVPFPSDSMMELIREVLEEEPRPIVDTVPECPAGLQELVSRCLAKSPDDRFAACGEISRELVAIREEVQARAAGEATVAKNEKALETTQLTRKEVNTLLAEAEVGGDSAPATPAPPERGAAKTALMTPEEVAAAVEQGRSDRQQDGVGVPEPPSEAARTSIMTSEQVEAALVRQKPDKPEPPTPARADDPRLPEIAGGVAGQSTLSAIGRWPQRAAAAGGKSAAAFVGLLQEGTRIAARRGKTVLGVAAVMVLAVVGGLMLRSRPASETRPRPVAQEAIPPAPSRPAEQQLGHVEVDALPWAEVVRILDAEAADVPLPSGAATPLRLDLPAGRYEIVLSHPSSPENQSCRVEIRFGESSHCRVEFFRVDALEYLTRAISGA